jgi:cobalt/nickel transport system permease protein
VSGSFSLADFLTAETSLYLNARRGLGRWDARLKLALCAAAILANVLLLSRTLSVLLWLAAWTGLAWSRVPWRQAALFIFAPLWATLLVMLGFGLGFGGTPMAHWGPFTLTVEGLEQGYAAGLRVLAEMSWVAALMLTTPFGEILDALRWYRLPSALVDLLAAMYRYIFLLYDEYTAMRAAALVRGGFNGYWRGLKSMGLILAQIFLRALDRAERIDQAMRVRGRDFVPPAPSIKAPHA